MLQKFLIKNLIKNTIHLGHKKNLRNQNNNTLLFGYRNNIDIINLNKTILNFLKIIPILKTLLLKNKHILIITNKKKYNIHTNLEKNIPFLFTSWSSGNLTNFKNLKKLKKKNFQLYIFPNIIFLLTYQKTFAIAKETNLTKIPLISINDTNAKIKYTTYTIPGNDNSITAENFYISIIQHTLFLSYIEKIKKFQYKNYSIKTKQTKIFKLLITFKLRNFYHFFKHLKNKKLLIIKNKNLKNIIYLKKNLKIKKYKIFSKYLKKVIFKKTQKSYKSKKIRKKQKKFLKKFKKIYLNNFLLNSNYTLPRLDSNQ